jgi:pSer/pThr/pTyr-binding forkhead associated (FHA) protein/chromosome segregation ATPase
VARLIYFLENGDKAIVTIGPENPHVLIGRNKDCAISTKNRTVSRNHCQVVFTGGAYKIYDLQSANGTFLHQNRIQEEFLEDGNLFYCGNFEIKFELEDHEKKEVPRVEEEAPPPAPVKKTTASKPAREIMPSEEKEIPVEEPPPPPKEKPKKRVFAQTVAYDDFEAEKAKEEVQAAFASRQEEQVPFRATEEYGEQELVKKPTAVKKEELKIEGEEGEMIEFIDEGVEAKTMENIPVSEAAIASEAVEFQPAEVKKEEPYEAEPEVEKSREEEWALSSEIFHVELKPAEGGGEKKIAGITTSREIDLDSVMREKEEKIHSLEVQVESLTNTVQTLTRLESALENAEKRIAELEKENQILSDEDRNPKIVESRKRIETNDINLKDLEGKILFLQNESDNKSLKIRELESDCTKLTETAEQKGIQLIEKDVLLGQIQEKLSSREKIFKEFEKEKSKILEQCEEKEMVIQAKEMELSEIKERLNVFESNKSAGENLLNEKISLLAEKDIRISEITNKLDELKQSHLLEKKQLEEEKNALSDKLQSFEKEFPLTKNEISELRGETERLKSDCSRQASEKKKVEDQFEENRKSFENFRKTAGEEISSLKEQLSRQDAASAKKSSFQIAEKDKVIEKMNADIINLESEIQKYKSAPPVQVIPSVDDQELAALRKEIEDLKNANKTYIKKFSKMMAENESFKKDLETARSSTVKPQADKARDEETANLKNTVSELQKEKAELESRLERFAERLKSAEHAPSGGDVAAVIEKSRELFDNINDISSSWKTNIEVLSQIFSEIEDTLSSKPGAADTLDNLREVLRDLSRQSQNLKQNLIEFRKFLQSRS